MTAATCEVLATVVGRNRRSKKVNISTIKNVKVTSSQSLTGKNRRLKRENISSTEDINVTVSKRQASQIAGKTKTRQNSKIGGKYITPKSTAKRRKSVNKSNNTPPAPINNGNKLNEVPSKPRRRQRTRSEAELNEVSSKPRQRQRTRSEAELNEVPSKPRRRQRTRSEAELNEVPSKPRRRQRTEAESNEVPDKLRRRKQTRSESENITASHTGRKGTKRKSQTKDKFITKKRKLGTTSSHADLQSERNTLEHESSSKTERNYNCPWYDISLKLGKLSALRSKYTSEFSVAEFLANFPDPFKYFYGKGSSESIPQAEHYLRERYNSLTPDVITSTFKKNNYNLASTCDELDSLCGNGKVQHPPLNYDDCNISLIEEAAFVEIKDEIKKYIQQKELERNEKLEYAKDRGESTECDCCLNECLAEEMETCPNGHSFCKTCIFRSAEIQFGCGKTMFPCLDDCDAEFSMRTIQNVLTPKLFSRLQQKIFQDEILAANVEGLETCPRCYYAAVLVKDDKVFRCETPDCLAQTCRYCKDKNHIPEPCATNETAVQVKMRTIIEDRMTKAVVTECYKCKRRFVKNGGCSRVACVCGAVTCYLCEKGIKFCVCFIKGRSRKRNRSAAVEGKKAKAEILALHQGIKLVHDPTEILTKKLGPKPKRKRKT